MNVKLKKVFSSVLSNREFLLQYLFLRLTFSIKFLLLLTFVNFVFILKFNRVHSFAIFFFVFSLGVRRFSCDHVAERFLENVSTYVMKTVKNLQPFLFYLSYMTSRIHHPLTRSIFIILPLLDLIILHLNINIYMNIYIYIYINKKLFLLY